MNEAMLIREKVDQAVGILDEHGIDSGGFRGTGRRMRRGKGVLKGRCGQALRRKVLDAGREACRAEPLQER